MPTSEIGVSLPEPFTTYAWEALAYLCDAPSGLTSLIVISFVLSGQMRLQNFCNAYTNSDVGQLRKY